MSTHPVSLSLARLLLPIQIKTIELCFSTIRLHYFLSLDCFSFIWLSLFFFFFRSYFFFLVESIVEQKKSKRNYQQEKREINVTQLVSQFYYEFVFQFSMYTYIWICSIFQLMIDQTSSCRRQKNPMRNKRQKTHTRQTKKKKRPVKITMSNTSVKEVFLSTCALAFAKNTYVDTDF